MTEAAELRPGRDSDAAGFIRLIGDCWGEFPGCVLDVDQEAPELHALASFYAAKGGALWAAEADGQVAGMVAAAPLGTDQAWEIARMYVAAWQRGTGLAQRLLSTAEAHAAAAGARRLVLWTDTRFEAAHRFYEKRGYVRSGSIRILDDLSKSLEFRYAKPLGPLAIEALDAAAASSAERRLGDILVACVDDGAAFAYLPPLRPETARAFWRGVSARVATGDCLLLAAWSEGELVGTVQLDLGTPADARHRADLEGLLVHPSARGRGIGRALVQRGEQAAQRHGRSLLVLEARENSAAEALCRQLGWTRLGCIPGYTRDAAGMEHGAAFQYKRL